MAKETKCECKRIEDMDGIGEFFAQTMKAKNYFLGSFIGGAVAMFLFKYVWDINLVFHIALGWSLFNAIFYLLSLGAYIGCKETIIEVMFNFIDKKCCKKDNKKEKK